MTFGHVFVCVAAAGGVCLLARTTGRFSGPLILTAWLVLSLLAMFVVWGTIVDAELHGG